MSNKKYDVSFQNGITTAEIWIRSAEYDEMEDNLKKMGILDLNELFYVGTYESCPESYQTFIDVMIDNGFEVETVYEGISCLLHVTREGD